MSRTRKLAAATAVAMLAIPAAAQAHVTLQPNTAPAGAFMVLDVRVPTERDDAATAKVDVQFPNGFAAASYQAVPGWRVQVIKKKLTTPIQTDDGPITEGVSRMVWTRTSRSGGIKPGQFQDFPISVQIPGKAGDKLTFKALQTYDNGDVVRWIEESKEGQPEPAKPAPVLTLTKAAAAGASAAPAADHHASQDASGDTAAAKSSDSTARTFGVVGIVVGVIGAALGVAGLRRKNGPAS